MSDTELDDFMTEINDLAKSKARNKDKELRDIIGRLTDHVIEQDRAAVINDLAGVMEKQREAAEERRLGARVARAVAPGDGRGDVARRRRRPHRCVRRGGGFCRPPIDGLALPWPEQARGRGRSQPRLDRLPGGDQGGARAVEGR